MSQKKIQIIFIKDIIQTYKQQNSLKINKYYQIYVTILNNLNIYLIIIKNEGLLISYQFEY